MNSFFVSSSCPVNTIPSSYAKSNAEDSEPRRVIRFNGLLALSGKKGITMTSKSLPASYGSSWAISFWIRLLEAPTGHFRTLFYKGDANGAGPGRTPSAWLLQQNNHITLRVSTETDADTKLDSSNKINAQEWNFLSFIFENRTSEDTGDLTSSDSRGSVNRTYTMKLYMNGHLDVEKEYPEVILGNDAPIQFFKDITHDGPVSLVHDLSIWEGKLTASRVLDLYLQGQFSTLTQDRNLQGQQQRMIDISTHILSASHSTLSDKQIDEGIESILTGAADGLRSCSLSVSQRMDMYAEAAEFGNAEALNFWGSILLMGTEVSDASCGLGSSSDKGQAQLYSGNLITYDTQPAGILAILLAADAGSSDASVILATLVSTGIMNEFLRRFEEARVLCDLLDTLPVPVETKDSRCGKTGVWLDHIEMTQSRYDGKYVLENYILWGGEKRNCNEHNDAAEESRMKEMHAIATALLHTAVIRGSSDAAQALGHRYKYGVDGTIRDSETAAFYYSVASIKASDAFHTIGGQPVVESDRINDLTADAVVVANTGDDDEVCSIQNNELIKRKTTMSLTTVSKTMKIMSVFNRLIIYSFCFIN